MQVLEIHSQLEERDHEKKEPLKDKEVAVLKEMCNVSLEIFNNFEMHERRYLVRKMNLKFVQEQDFVSVCKFLRGHDFLCVVFMNY
jgi:hypothetical protein